MKNHKVHPIDAISDERDKLRKEVRRLRKAVAELRRDKARMDALEQIVEQGGCVTDWQGQPVAVFVGQMEVTTGQTARQAIDAYIAAVEALQ